MREIVLDTETTGFDPFRGDRIVEIGCVELFNHMPTGETFHVYINPERGMPNEAFGVHGIGPDILEPPRDAREGEVTLLDKPVFAKVGRDFQEFIGTAKLVIHNASFDMKFLNAELDQMGLQKIPMDRAVDTLAMARQKFPGSPATLDALCRRFAIDNSNRSLHGALLDSEILAEVYLELIGGRQPDLVLGAATPSKKSEVKDTSDWRPFPRPAPLPPRISKEEAAAHEALVDQIGDGVLWKKLTA